MTCTEHNQIREIEKGIHRAAEFWIKLDDRLIHMRHFPVREPGGRYMVCLKVTQDVAGVKRLEGGKRPL